MMEKFCENQIRCKEDIEKGTWTCCAHLASGYCFQCNCYPSGIVDHKFIYYDGTTKIKKIMLMPGGSRCIDWKEVKFSNQEFITEDDMQL